MDSKHGQVRTGTQADLQSHRLPVPQRKQGQTHLGTLADLKLKNLGASHRPYCRVRQLMSLIGLLTAIEKQVPPRLAPHDADTVAPAKSLEDPRITRKGDPDPKMALPTPEKW